VCIFSPEVFWRVLHEYCDLPSVNNLVDHYLYTQFQQSPLTIGRIALHYYTVNISFALFCRWHLKLIKQTTLSAFYVGIHHPQGRLPIVIKHHHVNRGFMVPRLNRCFNLPAVVNKIFLTILTNLFKTHQWNPRLDMCISYDPRPFLHHMLFRTQGMRLHDYMLTSLHVFQ